MAFPSWPLVIIVGLLSLFASPAKAMEKNILIVESSALKPYETVALSFIEELSKIMVTGNTLTVRGFNYRRIVLSRTMNSIAVDEKNDLILAIGDRAFKAATRGKAPVIHVLVSHPEAIRGQGSRTTGVEMRLDPAGQLDALLAIFPAIKKIGVIYSHKNSAQMVRGGRRHLGARATIIALAAENARVLPARLDAMPPVDALWILPDPLLVIPETIEKTILFSLEHRIPVLVFAPKYLKTGAAVAVGFDLVGIGRQAAAMANAVLNGRAIKRIRPEMPCQKTTLNSRVIRQLRKWHTESEPGRE